MSLGLLGGGGSILAVPVLVYVAHLDPRTAIPVSLAVVGATSLLASFAHWRGGNVKLGAAALFGLSGMLAAALGARLTPLLAARTLLALFGGLMAVVGTLMVWRAAPAERRPGGAQPAAVMAAGLGVGLLTGFLGVGGGFLIVPALVYFARLPMREAVGTSLLVIALNCASGLAAHAQGQPLPVPLTLAFTAMAVAGALLGGRLGAQLSPEKLRRAFGLFVTAVGAVLLVTNLR